VEHGENIGEGNGELGTGNWWGTTAKTLSLPFPVPRSPFPVPSSYYLFFPISPFNLELPYGCYVEPFDEEVIQCLATVVNVFRA
jgi:hypothetical protein